MFKNLAPILIEIGRRELSRDADNLRLIMSLLYPGAEDFTAWSNIQLRFLAERLDDGAGLNGGGPTFWEPICKELSKEDAIYLFKGSVILERELNLHGGSVAANIFIFRHLYSHRITSFNERRELVDWALKNRGSNDYTPTGSMVVGKSLREDSEIRYECWKENNEKKEKLAQEIKLRKQARASAVAKHLEQGRERHSRRTELLSRLVQMSEIEKLDWLSSSDTTLHAIPPAIFDIEAITAHYQGTPDIEALTQRLGGYKGHWKKLLRSLEDRALRAGPGN